MSIVSNKARNARLLRTYGITCEEYDRLLASQNGVCFVCQNPPKRLRLNVDHDHKAERALKKLGRGPRESVRGLLCFRHNKGLQLFSDNASYLSRASEYLSNPPAKKVLLRADVQEQDTLRQAECSLPITPGSPVESPITGTPTAEATTTKEKPSNARSANRSRKCVG